MVEGPPGQNCHSSWQSTFTSSRFCPEEGCKIIQRDIFIEIPHMTCDMCKLNDAQLCWVSHSVLWECFLEFVQDDKPFLSMTSALLRRKKSGIDCRFYTQLLISHSHMREITVTLKWRYLPNVQRQKQEVIRISTLHVGCLGDRRSVSQLVILRASDRVYKSQSLMCY